MTDTPKRCGIKRGDMLWVESLQLVVNPCGLGTKYAYLRREEKVKVLAVSDGYAMVRFKGSMPFIESVKKLQKWNKTP